jgi:cytochrome P450
MVIQEAMRLYPAAWVTSRQPLADDQLGPYPIKAGSSVLIAFYGIHRNPAYWQNPDTFDPERFTPERSANRPGHAYMPFGNGPRFCIGSQFAMNEAQIVLATIVQRCRLRTLPGYVPQTNTVFTLRVKDALPMIINENMAVGKN